MLIYIFTDCTVYSIFARIKFSVHNYCSLNANVSSQRARVAYNSTPAILNARTNFRDENAMPVTAFPPYFYFLNMNIIYCHKILTKFKSTQPPTCDAFAASEVHAHHLVERGGSDLRHVHTRCVALRCRSAPHTPQRIASGVNMP